MLGVLPQFPGDRDGFSHLGMDEIAVISLTATIHKARGFQVSNEFSYFSWHPSRSVAEVSRKVVQHYG